MTGEVEKKTQRGARWAEVGTTKKPLWQLAEKAGKRLELPKRKEESGRSREEREAEAVQTAIDCLKALRVVEEDPKSNLTKGFWIFTLKLNHQTVGEKNLEEIKRKWQEQNPDETSPEPPPDDRLFSGFKLLFTLLRAYCPSDSSRYSVC